MLSRLVYLAPLVPSFLVAVLACHPWVRPTRPTRLAWLAACLGYILLDGAVTLSGYHLIAGLHWNWAGKGFSIVLALAAILILRPTRNELPFQIPATPARWGWTVLGFVTAMFIAGAVGFLFRTHAWPSAETLTFQATMPGLSEELCWRGLVFTFCGRAYSRPDGTPNFAPASVIATLLFGVVHGVSADHGPLRFVWLPFLYALIFGAGLAFLRIRSKSLPALVLTHNAANLCGSLMNGLP